MGGTHGSNLSILPQCIALGRPPSINLAHIDCELPTDEDADVADNGDTMQGCKSHSLWICLYSFTRNLPNRLALQDAILARYLLPHC